MWDRHRFLVLRGGAGSGKSVFCAQKLLARLAMEPRHKFCVLRKVLNTQRHSTFSLMSAIIGDWGWGDHCVISRGKLEITFLPTGSQVIFLGLDDVEKLKSIAGITGFWIEEATELSSDDFEQVNLRLRGRLRNYKQILLSFNPVSAQHWLKRRFYDTAQHGHTRTTLTTYRDNRWIDPEYAAQLEALKDRNHQLWRVYARGEWGVLKGLIFEPWPVVTWPTTWSTRFYGLDFGYNDPTALMEVVIRDGVYTVAERIYASGLTTTDLIARLGALGVDRKAPIYTDAAEPDRIEEICRAGYNCHPADKRQGSVNAGISTVQACRPRTLAENTNLNAELAVYCWAEDKAGTLLDKPVDWKNHAIDAVRYAIHTHHIRGGFEIKGAAFEGTGIW